MQETIFQNYPFKKKIFEHVIILSVFLILTMIVTFPVILDFTTEAAGQGCYDKCHMMWRIWWADFSNENNLDFYHSQYIFQPNGVSISGNLAQFTTGIGSILLNTFGNILTWNIIWLSSFVFGGYGAFLLAYHFTKNSYASIIGGIIFTFSTYHIIHSQFHIGLSMIVWLPLFTLILFKILEKNSKILIVLGSVFFFLASITHLYFFVFLVMFSIVFFIVYIFKEKSVPNRTFIVNFLLILGIGIFVSLLAFSPILNSDSEYPNRTLDEHIRYSSGLANFFTPTFFHSSQIYSDYNFMLEMNSLLNEDTQNNQSAESFSYLGYPVIFLSIFALKFRFKFSWFWVLIGVGSALLSLGPELKILNNLTGILMPERILYDYVPGWEEFRASGRFVIITHLSMAVLSAFAVNGIMKSKFLSKKILVLILVSIMVVIIFDVSAIPYPSYNEPVSKIYEEIRNDVSNFVVLESPIGSMTTDRGISHPTFGYYQTFHEKPIIGGYESRATVDELEQTNTYFLKNFQLLKNQDFFGGDKYTHQDFNDIVKQDLGVHGVSILNNLNIKYVIIHKSELVSVSDLTTRHNSIGESFVSGVSDLMLEILDDKRSYFEDDKVIVYKIPKSNSEKPFILLGEGWYEFDSDDQARAMSPKAEIKIINPKDTKVEYSIKIKLIGYKQEQKIQVLLNNKYLQEFNIPETTTTLKLNKLKLSPGENIITLNSDRYEIWLDSHLETEYKISLIGLGISGE